MNARMEVSVDAFRAALKAENIRGLQIIYGGIATALFIFAMIVFFTYNTNSAIPAVVDPSDVELVQMLSIAHFLLALSVYGIAPLLEKAALKNMLLTSSQTLSPAAHCFNSIRNALIIRLAMYEGAALFGLVVCFLAVNNSVIFAAPVYWLNAASSPVVVAYIALTFPNQERLTSFFEEQVRRNLG